MAEYRLGVEAENDLLEIGRYSMRTWDLDQAERYLGTLEDHFCAISAGHAQVRRAFEHRADLFVSRCLHHYIFFARSEDDVILVLAIFHESMDLTRRLRERLKAGGHNGGPSAQDPRGVD